MNVSYSSSDGGDLYLPLDIIKEHILNKLDGATLLSFRCVSSDLREICSEESLWKNICNSYWPKTKVIIPTILLFPSGHRSFFLDSYPTLWKLNKSQTVIRFPDPIISMVHVYFRDEVIYSKLEITNASSHDRFMKKPLRIVIRERARSFRIPVNFDNVACSAKVEENAKLSWVVIDVSKNRAVNLSSLTPVKVIRSSQSARGKVRVSFGSFISVAGAGEGFLYCAVYMICREEKIRRSLSLEKVSMHWEDMDGRVLNGEESLGILKDAMEGKRVIRRKGEAKIRHERFLEMRGRRKNGFDLLNICLAIIFIGISMYMPL